MPEVCDACPGFDDNADADADGDGFADGCDPCPNTPGIVCTCCDLAGDANDNGSTNIADAIYIINTVFNSGPAPACGPNNMSC